MEAALRTQDASGKCGIRMDPDKGLVRLKALAARGIEVRLPDSIFRTVGLPARLQKSVKARREGHHHPPSGIHLRTVRLPARLHKSVKVSQREVGLRLTAESLRIETATLWSSFSVQVQTSPKP